MWTGTLHRYVAVFQKDGDELISKASVSQEEFEAIRRLLGHDESDAMYDCYPLLGDVLREVKSLLGERLPQGKYDYLLEAERD
jgi:hypothetical protein